MSDAPLIAVTRSGGVAELVLNRPDKRNALDEAMVAELRDACAAIDRDPQVRVVILRGAGKTFSAGGDIDAWSGETPLAFGRRWIRDGHDAFDALARLRQPVIALLDGHALGGGLELAACADYRIAEAHVKLGQPETGLGVVPGWSGTQRAVRRFGAQAVRRMALFGEILTADEARALGIVDRVVPSGSGLAEAQRLAAAVLARGERATEATKMLINAAEGEERERVLDVLAGEIAAGSQELAEGIAAFREKRAPKFGLGEDDS